MRDYSPYANTLPEHVCAFFQRNREEELIPRDIEIKFDAPRGTVHQCLVTAVRHGWLTKRRERNRRVTYCAGPKLPFHIPVF